jgi:methylated-DNA-[protein]-cysteine S-methyltransferase
MHDIERDLKETAGELPAGPADALTAELVRRADKEGLLNVAYAAVDSPVGVLTVAATKRGLVRVAYSPPDEVVGELAAKLSPRVMEAPARLDDVRRELEEYFDGRRRDFDVPLDWSLTRGFVRSVLRATARVPFGDVTTYRQVATAAGSPRAVRAAGNALGANPIPVIVPCHRVLRTGGGLGGYTGGLDIKQRLLELEGVLAA